jgi:VanZ family protein
MSLNFKYYGPALLWALFILTICSIKMGDIGSGHLFFPGFDKLVHCGLFFVLVVFYCNGFIRKHGQDNLTYLVFVKIIIGAILYGGLIEVLQAYVFTWRSGELADLFADAVGTCMGIFSVLLTMLAIKNVKE